MRAALGLDAVTLGMLLFGGVMHYFPRLCQTLIGVFTLGCRKQTQNNSSCPRGLDRANALVRLVVDKGMSLEVTFTHNELQVHSSDIKGITFCTFFLISECPSLMSYGSCLVLLNERHKYKLCVWEVWGLYYL